MEDELKAKTADAHDAHDANDANDANDAHEGGEIPEGHSLIKDEALEALIAMTREVTAGARSTEERWKAAFERVVEGNNSMVAGLTVACKAMGEEIARLTLQRAESKMDNVRQEQFAALAQVALEWVPEDEHKEVMRAALRHVRAGGRITLSR